MTWLTDCSLALFWTLWTEHRALCLWVKCSPNEQLHPPFIYFFHFVLTWNKGLSCLEEFQERGAVSTLVWRHAAPVPVADVWRPYQSQSHDDWCDPGSREMQKGPCMVGGLVGRVKSWVSFSSSHVLVSMGKNPSNMLSRKEVMYYNCFPRVLLSLRVNFLGCYQHFLIKIRLWNFFFFLPAQWIVLGHNWIWIIIIIIIPQARAFSLGTTPCGKARALICEVEASKVFSGRWELCNPG